MSLVLCSSPFFWKSHTGSRHRAPLFFWHEWGRALLCAGAGSSCFARGHQQLCFCPTPEGGAGQQSPRVTDASPPPRLHLNAADAAEQVVYCERFSGAGAAGKHVRPEHELCVNCPPRVTCPKAVIFPPTVEISCIAGILLLRQFKYEESLNYTYLDSENYI